MKQPFYFEVKFRKKKEQGETVTSKENQFNIKFMMISENGKKN